MEEGQLSRASSKDKSYNVRLVAGSANKELAEKVAQALGTELEPCIVGRFSDGEIKIEIQHNVRGDDVFIIQPTCPSAEPYNGVNTAIMELLLLIHTLKLSSAKRITAVVPYFGYARQDRKTKARVPISAAAVAQLIEAMGPNRVVTVDLHCGQIQGFFHSTPVDNLFAENQFVNYIKEKNLDMQNVAIVSPDAGGVTRARRLADKLGANQVVTILKRRAVANEIEAMQIVGQIEGFIVIIVDDMIDTAGTLCKAASLLKSKGCLDIYACASHGIFSGPAMQRINNSVLTEVCVTDSIAQDKNLAECDRLKVVSLVPLISEAIARLHNEKSLSILFKDKE